MTLNRLAVRVGMFWHQQELIRAQAKLIKIYRQQRGQAHLDHCRELHGLISAWLICLETPEVDMRDSLAAMEQALSERVAVLEEHIL